MFTIVLASNLLCKLLFLLGFATDIASMVMVWSQKSIPLSRLWSQMQKTCMAIHIICDHKIAIHILHTSDSFLHLHNMFALAAFTRWCCIYATLDMPYFYDKYAKICSNKFFSFTLFTINMFWFYADCINSIGGKHNGRI